jgi:hypothetical protein
MIADLLPLLAFTAFVVIARNVFEAHVMDQQQRRMEARELVRVKARAGRHGHSRHAR